MVLSLLFPPSIHSQEAHWKKPWPLHILGQSRHGFSFVTPLRKLYFSVLICLWEINIYLFFKICRSYNFFYISVAQVALFLATLPLTFP